VTQVVLGADTLCWHARLEAGEIDLDGVLAEARQAGAAFVQLNLHHARALDDRALAALARRADGEGLRLLASGDFLQGDDARERVARWAHRAAVIGSPSLRVASGFYRADLADRPDLIAAQAEHVVAVLGASRDLGVRLLLENHSDFTAAEYVEIVERIGDVGVFLDMINPVSSFEDPAPVIERLAPLAPAGHIKDYELASDFIPDGYHRRGWRLRWRYPGEGAADLKALLGALLGAARGEFLLSVEGLDNQAGVADQVVRLQASLDAVQMLIASEPCRSYR
jgi:sugar phosphate isomerase/epimerase